MRPGYRVPPVTRPSGCHVPVHQALSACGLFLRIRGTVRTVIEPVPKAVEAMFHEVFCCSKVEPRIDCDVSVAVLGNLSLEMMVKQRRTLVDDAFKACVFD